MPTGDLNVTEARDTLDTVRPGVAFGNTYTDLILNALFRGSVGTPPTTLYFSLGAANSTNIPAEISGVTRTAVKVNRGWLNGMDSNTYPYQSTGTVNNNQNVQWPIDIYAANIGSSTFTSFCIMVFDAATSGNLLMVIEPAWLNIAEIVNGDIVRIGSNTVDVATPGGLCTETKYLPMWGKPSTSAASLYVYALLMDWLFRGFASMTGLYDPGTFPNVYASFFNNTTGAAITDVPRLAIARNTSNWAAPVDLVAGASLRRKMVNAVDFTFAAATATNSYGNAGIKFFMTSTPQSFDDTIYAMRLGALTINSGDVFKFPAGALEIIWS